MEGSSIVVKQLRGILSVLQNLNDNWNDDYWIWVGGGTLYLMKYNKNGKRAMLPGGGVDPIYIVESYGRINADGGGW